MKRLNTKLVQWYLVFLFTSYVSGISLFTHTHIINHSTFIHSHPFFKGEQKQHSHTQNQLLLLDYFYHTTIFEDIIPEINLCDLSLPRKTIYIEYYNNKPITKPLTGFSLRSPPSAA